MAPLSDIDHDLIKLSEKFKQLKTEEQTSAYNIEDDVENSSSDKENLDDCSTIKEKAPISPQKHYNHRSLPYQRDDNRGQANFANIFNDLNLLNYCLYDDTNDNNIPEPVLNIPVIQNIHTAEKQLSDCIDKNKKLKQEVWIAVNIEDDHNLLKKLKNKIESTKFNHITLNYIYAIIIRLRKDENGKQILLDYLSTENVLYKVALKRNQLLMNFILEIYSNNSINYQGDLLHHIINNQTDLSDMFELLINYKLNNNYMFDVNWINLNGETVLMVLLQLFGDEKKYDMNLRYLDLILGRSPDINLTSNNGQNIFHFAYFGNCGDYVIDRIKSHHDETTVQNLMWQMDYNGWSPIFFTTPAC